MMIPKPKPSKGAEKHAIPPEEERDPDQAWFWTEEWQRDYHEAKREIEEGLGEVFDSMDEFLDSLDD